jgi:membrane fusion protein (multidrug efflux system)
MNATTLSAPETNASRINRATEPIVQPARPNGDGRLDLIDAVDSTNRRKTPRRFFKRFALGALIVVAGLAAIALGRHWWTVGRFMESTDDAYVGGDVTVIAPKVAGFVAQLAVTDNQPVHAGDLLVKLDDRDYRAALARAEAAVAIQQAALTNFDALARLQQAVIAQAQAALAATSAETQRSHDDKARYQHLVSTGAVSTQSFQHADTDYKQALANDEKARAALTAAQRQLEVIATQKLQAQAALQQAIAERDLAQLNLGYTELRAPIDGIVGNRSAQVGAYATVGSQLISLVPARGLWIDANFKESQLAEIHPGSPASVKVDLISGKKFHGHVVSIAPATGAQFSVLPPENATGNFTKIVQRVTVRIVIDGDATRAQLRPGLSVTAKVDTRETGKAAL